MTDKQLLWTDQFRPVWRYGFVMLLLAWSRPLAGDEPIPTLMGRSSCASATCHGAVLGPHRDWRTSATVWETYDPHARAGQQLFSDRSRQIVTALVPESIESEAKYRSVLQTRCVSCHATVSAAMVSAADDSAESATGESSKPLTDREFAAGVSCESCHGPASRWIDEHTQASWEGPARFAAQTGMRDTESWLTRTETCTRCHVGSRSDDGLVRDMNHDMIAAGHPVLRFDMATYFMNLPPHWGTGSDLKEIEGSEFRRQRAARWKSLQAAAELARERIRDHAEDPRVAAPEFADFDCFACHHALSGPDRPFPRSKSGLPDWNPWYTRRLGILPEQLERLPTMAMLGAGRVDAHDPRWSEKWDEQLSMIASDATAQSQATMAMPGPAPSELLDSIHQQGDDLMDWYDAALWYLEAQAALRDLARGGEGSVSITLDLSELRRTHLQFDDAVVPWESPARFDAEAWSRDRRRLLQRSP